MRIFIFLFPLLLSPPVWAYKLPSSVGFSQTFDNDQNRLSALDITIGTPFYAMIAMGATFSRMQFDENHAGQTNNYYIGMSSNPLRDWVFASQMNYVQVSDQMKIYNPSLSLTRYFAKINFKLDIGYRIIETELTPGLAFLLRTQDDFIRDENFWWNLSTNIEAIPNFIVGVSYWQFQYSTRFDFFTTAAAQPLGYTLDTINYGASFADYIFSINGTVFRNRWDFSLDYTFVKNEFEDAKIDTWTPSVGFRLNDNWYFNASIGLSRGVITGEEDRSGGFLSLGTTFSF